MRRSRFRPRFTVRGLMVAVAIVAPVIGGRQMWRHRQECLTPAAEAGRREENFRSLGLDIAGDPSMARSETAFAIMPEGDGIVEFRQVGAVRRVFYPRPRPGDPSRWVRSGRGERSLGGV